MHMTTKQIEQYVNRHSVDQIQEIVGYYEINGEVFEVRRTQDGKMVDVLIEN